MLPAPLEIFKYYDVSDRIAISGQPSNHQFQLIKDAGKDVVLQLVVKEASYSATDEAYHLSNLGVIHESMDISFGNPKITDVQQFMNIMEKHESKSILVHCAAGYCTIGLMVIYLMKTERLSFEEAKKRIAPDWQPVTAWQELISQCIV